MPNRRDIMFLCVLSTLCVTGTGALLAPQLVTGQNSPDTPPTSTPGETHSSSTQAPVNPVAPAAPGASRDKNLADQPPTDAVLTDLVDPQWVSTVSTATGIAPVALTAYAGASIVQAQVTAQCGLGWNTLAGIAEVESHHGTINGSALDASGTATPHIVGVALNGEGVAAIPDSDAGQIDGDTQWDRAVGPMQFIPQTWATFAQDGNGDGVQDPQNIYDSALAAAAYLCHTGGDLREADQWIDAVKNYNNDVQYNNDVAGAANKYAKAAQTP